MLCLRGTLSLDPKGATLESRKHSHYLLLSHPPGHFQENRRDSLSSPSCTSSPWKSEDFNPYRQNRILTHAKEMNPTCPQSLRYNHLLRGDQIQAPGKGVSRSLRQELLLSRGWAPPDPTAEAPGVLESLSRRPEAQWLDKPFIPRAVPSTGHLHKTHPLSWFQLRTQNSLLQGARRKTSLAAHRFHGPWKYFVAVQQSSSIHGQSNFSSSELRRKRTRAVAQMDRLV